MKINKVKLCCILILASLIGCDNGQFDLDAYAPSIYAHYLDVSRSDFKFFSGNRQEVSFDVYAYDTPWRLNNSLSWIVLSPNDGNCSKNVYMTVHENASLETARLGLFYLESEQVDWTYAIPMSVEQAAADPYAILSETNVSLSAKAAEREIVVTTNCEYDVECNVDWLSVGIKMGRLVLLPEENTSQYSRSGTVSIMYKGKLLAKVVVVQQVADVTIYTSPISCGVDAAEYTISFTSDVAWTATTLYEWLQVSPAEGEAGSNEITVSVLPNTSVKSREGYVYIHIGGNMVASLCITQEGVYLSGDKTYYTFSSGVEEGEAKIYSNTNWEVESVPDWLTIEPMSGKGNQTLKLKLQDNPNISNRTATVKVYVAGLSIYWSFDVEQKGKTFSFNTSKIRCSDDAQVLKVNVKSDGFWKAESKDSWISLNPTSNQGDAELEISVSENFGEEERTGNVDLIIGNKTYGISIVQDGKFIAVECSKAVIGSTGGTLQIDIASNADWTVSAEGNPSWLSLSPASGKDSVSVVATFADNPSVNPRKANIIVNVNSGRSVKILVEQAARYMTVSHQSILFFAKGGVVDDIEVNTDGTISVEPNVDWLTCKLNSDNTLSVTAVANATKVRREGLIKISLTGLAEGEYSLSIPVYQAAEGASFVKNPYKEDVSWDIGGNESLNFTVTGFSEDKNWDADLTNKKISITVNGYNSDKNWDK